MRAPAPLVLLLAACSGASAIEGNQVHMDFAATANIYSAPFPSEHLRTAAGGIALRAFPNPGRVELVDEARALIEAESDGFALTSAVYFTLDAAPDVARLPDVHASTRDGATVFLMDVGAGSPELARRLPISAAFFADPGPFGAPNLLALLPQQGIPLRPATRYAAVVLRALGDASGAELGVSLAMAQLVAGEQPAGLGTVAFRAYREAIAALGGAGVDTAAIAGLAVFETGDPARAMRTLFEAAAASPAPELRGPFTRGEVFDDYCVYSSTIAIADHQEGEPPFSEEGGAIRLDANGAPIVQRIADARFVVTIPRRPMPAAGFPAAVFIRTGGGGDRPLVDRGVHAEPHGASITPGAGPALHFARAGFAGISVDGPHGGLRNPGGADEQFLVINVFNPVALRDNIRESALELALLPSFLGTLEIDLSDCPGASATAARVDVQRLALMGHSMGATIAPLVLAVQPAYRAAILSGAGGSWIENIVHKRSPVLVSGLAKVILGYSDSGRELVIHDPALSLVQWAGEPADPPIYARAIIHEADTARHVLMFQGITDTYILPPIANATSLSLGLDLAAPALEDSLPRMLDLSGRTVIDLPAAGNLDGTTGVVVQHAQDDVEDGHEVVFQRTEPKLQYRCFLESFAAGAAPRVVPAGAEDAPCEAP